MNKLRSSKPQTLNVSIVEDHDKALSEIYAEIGRKKLSMTNLTLVHFDSHPDLGIPKNLQADLIFNRDELIDALSIENWILPIVYAGHLNKIVWIKPEWASQINCGLYELYVGKDTSSGQIKCNCRESYFLNDMTYLHEDKMSNKKQFTLYVCDFNSILNKDDKILNQILVDAKQTAKSLILDVDLDFFSTKDPFMQMFASGLDDYELFKSVYKTMPEFSIDDSDFDVKFEKYSQQKLIKLRKLYDCLTTDHQLEIDKKINDLKLVIDKNQIDMEILHEYGSCLDDRPLPHNITPTSDIVKMLDQFFNFVVKYFSTNSVMPSLITVARSSIDDYCPQEQVEFIQREFLAKLNIYFEKNCINLNVCNNYLNE